MSLPPRSDLLDLQAGLPIGPDDVDAQRRARRYLGPPLLAHPELLAPSWPEAPSTASRPTAENRDPFEL